MYCTCCLFQWRIRGYCRLLRRKGTYYINFGAGPNITCTRISNLRLSLGQMIQVVADVVAVVVDITVIILLS